MFLRANWKQKSKRHLDKSAPVIYKSNKMIKVLLDTNILVSGFASFNHPDRPPAQILHEWRNGKFQLILSEHILSEVERTLNTPYFRKHVSDEEIHQVFILLKEEGV